MSKSTASIQKSIFPYGYRAEYSTELSLAPAFITMIYDALVQSSTIQALLSASQLENFKGRDAQQRLLETAPPIGSNEILLVEGALLPVEEESEETESIPFRYMLHTPYAGSAGGSVNHTIEKQSNAILPDSFSFPHLGRIVPAELTFFRFGLQKFTSRMFSSLVGIAPVISGSLLLDCSNDILKIRCTDEGLKSKQIPWLHSPVLKSINTSLAAVCDFDLCQDMAEKLNLQ